MFCKKLNGEAKILLEQLSLLREQDKIQDSEWKKEHNRSSKEFRDEIKAAIADIWKAMREGFDKLSEAILLQKSTPSWDWKTIAVVSAISFSLFGFLGQQIAFLWNVTETGYAELKREDVERFNTQRELQLLKSKEIKAEISPETRSISSLLPEKLCWRKLNPRFLSTKKIL